MKRKLCLIFAVLLLLSGCVPSEELFTPPRPREDYVLLQRQIERITAEKQAVLSAPLLGNNRQAVSLVDVDQDSVPEVVVCLKSSVAERNLAVLVFKQIGDQFQRIGSIEGMGSAINSINFQDLTGDKVSEIIVSWNADIGKVKGLSIHSLKNGVFEEILSTNHGEYTLCDLDMDGTKEMIVFNPTDSGTQCQATYYRYDGENLAKGETITLHGKSDLPSSVKTGFVEVNQPAVFVESMYANQSFTDILTIVDGTFGNLSATAPDDTGVDTTRAIAAICQDINGDGIIEIPKAAPLPGELESNTGAANRLSIDWDCLLPPKTWKHVCTTYSNAPDKWFFVIPEHWRGQYTVRSAKTASIGEESVTFYAYVDGKLGDRMFTIYTLTGELRKTRAAMPGRVELYSNIDTIYCFEIFSEQQGSMVAEQEDIQTGFHYVPKEFGSGELMP